MDQSDVANRRRSSRSNVFMKATLELSGGGLDVRLRNLSPEGALVEGEGMPLEGTPLTFRRNDLAVAGRVAWLVGQRAGIAFDSLLSPDEVLHHVPAPKPRQEPSFKRPGFSARPLSAAERRMAEDWVWRPSLDKPGD